MRMHRPRRPLGMTLLEVLIATAILAMLTAACLPLISQAMTLLRHDKPPNAFVDIVDLAIVADAFVSGPATFGWKERPLHEIDRWEFQWPVEGSAGSIDDGVPLRETISVQAIAPHDPSADHLWLRFECDGVGVCRWVPIPKTKSAPEELP